MRWEKGILSDFVDEFIVPQRDKPKDFEGSVPWCRIEDFEGRFLNDSKSGRAVTQEQIQSMPLRVFPKGCVAVSCSADLGRSAICTQELVTNQTFIGLVCGSTLNPEFLQHAMTWRSKELNQMATGATIKYLSKKKFQSLPFYLPPLEEQERIVEVLDEAFAAIDKAKANIERNLTNARELFQSRLNDIFSNPAEDWELSTLAELANIARGGSPRPIKEFLTEELDGVNWIKISDATASGKFIEHTKQKIRKEGVPRSRMVYPGDFLLSNSMSFGRPYIMKTTGAIHDGWLVFQDIVDSVSSDFLYHLLTSKLVGDQFEEKASGSTVRNLNIDRVKSVQVSIPPIEEQNRFIVELDQFKTETELLATKYQSELGKLEELRQSILEQAFEGKLTEPVAA